MQEQNYIHIKSEDGYLRPWKIEDKTPISFKIFYMGLITEIRKDECYEKNNKLYSDKIINIKYNNGNVAMADFIHITLES